MNITKFLFTKSFINPTINSVFSCLVVGKCNYSNFKQIASHNRNWCTTVVANRSYTLENLSKLTSKKRPLRKKWTEEIEKEAGKFNVVAFATAEEYNLEELVAGLIKQDLYEPKSFFSTDNLTVEPDVLYVKAKYKVEEEPRDIFFFREGTVVMWNISDLEVSNILSFLRQFEQDRYDNNIVQSEVELMPYSYHNDEESPAMLRKGQFILSQAKNDDTYLEKYTFSNAMSLSVKLGIWEASLETYIGSMEYVTDDLKNGKQIKITRQGMLQKTGELFALKQLINLSSDLLDTPDFYWDREPLELLYSQTGTYFSIPRRTRVMNEKLNHCIELADLISSNLNDKHHIRLEWMIIILIMVEVLFEIIHYAERYLGAHEVDPPAEQRNSIEVLQSVD